MKNPEDKQLMVKRSNIAKWESSNAKMKNKTCERKKMSCTTTRYLLIFVRDGRLRTLTKNRFLLFHNNSKKENNWFKKCGSVAPKKKLEKCGSVPVLKKVHTYLPLLTLLVKI